ncbi:MAG: NHL repeat-containing protein [bacterium]
MKKARMKRFGSYLIWFLLIFASSFTINVYLYLLTQTPPLKPRGEGTPFSGSPVPPAPSEASRMNARVLTRQLREPYGLTEAADHSIYIVDVERRRKRGLLYEMQVPLEDTPSGSSQPAILREVQLKKVKLDFPTDVFFSHDSLYVIDHGENDEVLKFKPDGALTRRYHSAKGFQALLSPKVVAVDRESGLVYVGDRGNRRLVVLNQALEPIRVQSPPKEVAKVFTPNGITVGPDATLFVSDKSLGRIYRFASDGKYIDFFGGYGAEAAGKFLNPAGLDVAPDGTVYVADSDRNLIEIFNKDGKFLNAWSQKELGSLFESPRDVLVLSDGKRILVTGGDMEKGGVLWLITLVGE